VYFAPPINGFLLEFGIGAGMFKATGWRKKFDDIFSHVDTIHQRDRQTDGRTDRHRATANTALTHSVVR